MDLNTIDIQFLLETAERLADILDSDYFGEKFKDYVSNSQLKLINPDEGGSPELFLKGFADSKSPALELGTAVHQMILEKEKYFLSEVEKPSGKIGPMVDTAYDLLKSGEECIYRVAMARAAIVHDYYSASLTDKRIGAATEKGQEYFDFLIRRDSDPSIIVLTAGMRERLTTCVDSVKANKSIMDLLKPVNELDDIKSFSEDVITLKVKAVLKEPGGELELDSEQELTFDLKSKIDNWSINFTNKVITLNDLKTTSTPVQYFAGRNVTHISADGIIGSPRHLPGSFQKYHYYRQMAMYGQMLWAYCVQEYGVDESWTFNTHMLVVETVAPFNSQVFKLSEQWIKTGKVEFKELLQRLAFHKIKGFDKSPEFTGLPIVI